MSFRDSVRYRRLVPGDLGSAGLVETVWSVGRRCFHAGVCVWHCVSVSRLARVVAGGCVCFSCVPSWCCCLAWLQVIQPFGGESGEGQYHPAGLAGTSCALCVRGASFVLKLTWVGTGEPLMLAYMNQSTWVGRVEGGCGRCELQTHGEGSEAGKGDHMGEGIGAPGARYVGEHVVVRALGGLGRLFVAADFFK